jgi:hypothetical protein
MRRPRIHIKLFKKNREREHIQRRHKYKNNAVRTLKQVYDVKTAPTLIINQDKYTKDSKL